MLYCASEVSTSDLHISHFARLELWELRTDQYRCLVHFLPYFSVLFSIQDHLQQLQFLQHAATQLHWE